MWWSTDGDDKRGRLVFVKAHRVKKLVDYFTDLGNAATVQTKGNEQALILYNFKLKNLRTLLGCEEATRAMAHYHP